MDCYSDFKGKELCFSGNVKIDNPQALDRFVNNEIKKEKADKTNHTMFRGINEAKYKLYNSFQRVWKQRNLQKIGVQQSEMIQQMINICKSKDSVCYKHYKQLGVICNEWLVLSFLQHYGAMSPFLDFSKSYKVALFFAFKDLEYRYSSVEIDNYVSLYYCRIKDVLRDLKEVGSLKSYAESVAEDKESCQTKDGRLKLNTKIWNEELSFRAVTEKFPVLVIPRYDNQTNICNKRIKIITKYIVANLNATCQDGEFVCNVTDEPLEMRLLKDGKSYLKCANIHKGLKDYIIKKYLEGSMEKAHKKYFLTGNDIAKEAQDKALSLDWNK